MLLYPSPLVTTNQAITDFTKKHNCLGLIHDAANRWLRYISLPHVHVVMDLSSSLSLSLVFFFNFTVFHVLKCSFIFTQILCIFYTHSGLRLKAKVIVTFLYLGLFILYFKCKCLQWLLILVSNNMLHVIHQSLLFSADSGDYSPC